MAINERLNGTSANLNLLNVSNLLHHVICIYIIFQSEINSTLTLTMVKIKHWACAGSRITETPFVSEFEQGNCNSHSVNCVSNWTS